MATNPAAIVPARTSNSCCCGAVNWFVDVGDLPDDRDVNLRVEIAAEVDRAVLVDIERASLKAIGAAYRIERAGQRVFRPRVFVEIQIAGHAQVNVTQSDGRAARHLHVLADQPQRVRHVDRDVKAEALPRIERGNGVDLLE